MFETSLIVGKLVNTILQNFSFIIEPMPCKKIQKVNCIPHIAIKCNDITKDFSSISETAKNIVFEENLDLSNSQNVQGFIEQRTNFFNDFIYNKNPPLVALLPLKDINNKIVEEVKKRDRNGKNEKKGAGRNKKGIANQENNIRNNKNSCGRKFLKSLLFSTTSSKQASEKLHKGKKEASKLTDHEKNGEIEQKADGILKIKENNSNSKNNVSKDQNKNKVSWWDREGTVASFRCNLTANAVRYAEKETELHEKYLFYHSRDADFIRRNVHVELYVSLKDFDENGAKIRESMKQQIFALCKQALLSQIEPSHKAFVIFEKNIPKVVMHHLKQGCENHFGISRHNNDYSALLVLSNLAKILLKNPNATLIHTLSYILKCTPSKILVLALPHEDFS